MAYGFDEDKNKVQVLEKSQAGEVSNLKTSNKSNIVAAVNEVFQFANDGKAKLAAAIGTSITNSTKTPPKPSAGSTWDQLINGMVKVKIATLGAKDFSVSIKSERVVGSSGSGILQTSWDYTRHTHTTSKIEIPFSNIILLIGSGTGSNADGSISYAVPIGPSDTTIRTGFGDWYSAALSHTKTTENGKTYIQIIAKTVQGSANFGAPDANAAACGKLQTMSLVIVGY